MCSVGFDRPLSGGRWASRADRAAELAADAAELAAEAVFAAACAWAAARAACACATACAAAASVELPPPVVFLLFAAAAFWFGCSVLVDEATAGADSIADMAVLRHGGMNKLFSGVRAPTTLGTFLRSLKFGHVRQLDAVAARFLTGLNRQVDLIDPAAAITLRRHR